MTRDLQEEAIQLLQKQNSFINLYFAMKHNLFIIWRSPFVVLLLYFVSPFILKGQSTEMVTYTFDMSDFEFVTTEGGNIIITSSTYDIVYDADPEKPAIPYLVASILVKGDEIFSSVDFTYENPLARTGIHLISNPQLIEVTESWDEDAEEILYSPGIYPTEDNQGYFLSQGIMDGHRIINIKFSPFKYDASTCELNLFSKVIIEISTKKSKEQVIRSKNTMDGFISSFVRNANKKDEYYPKTNVKQQAWGPGYLIICPDDLKAEFNLLLQWKKEKGLNAVLIGLDSIYNHYNGTNEAIKVKRCIKDYYQNHGVKYVLLCGDGTNFPMVECKSFSPRTSDVTLTDWFYACLDESEEFAFDWNADGDDSIGNFGVDKVDLYPEVILSRAPVENETEARVFVKKILDYEKNPPVDDWYNNILFSEVRITDSDPDFIGSESSSRTLYDNYIKPYFQADTQMLLGNRFFQNENDSRALTSEKFHNALQKDFHIVHHFSHGEIERFCLSAKGVVLNKEDEYYDLSYVEQLQVKKPRVFVALSCWTNSYKHPNNIGRRLIVSPNSGVFAYIGTTVRSRVAGIRGVFTGGIVDFHESLFKFLLEDGETKGELGYSFMKSKIANVNDVRHTYMFNMCGDPETSIYLKRPQEFDNLSIMVSEGEQYMVDFGVEGCTVAVRYKDETGNIYKREYRENVASYSIPGNDIGDCEITLTHKNYIPMTFSIDPDYIQNETFVSSTDVSGDLIIAGRNVTDKKSIGDVIIQSGKTTFSAQKGIILAPGFSVNQGATFETKIQGNPKN